MSSPLAVATRGLCADVLHTALAEHEVVVGEQVLTELGRTLQEKFRISAELAQETEEFMRREAEVVSEAPKLEITVRDADFIASSRPCFALSPAESDCGVRIRRGEGG